MIKTIVYFLSVGAARTFIGVSPLAPKTKVQPRPVAGAPRKARCILWRCLVDGLAR